MSSPDAVLEAIKRSRETRDRIMLQNAIPLLNQLRIMVNTWVDDEFKDFENEIEQVDCSAPRESATERINRFRMELNTIRNQQLPQALRELDSLIELINQQRFETAEDAIEMLKEKMPPILIVMFNLTKARERLDGMADMIPLPIEEAEE
jgi:hypothetical protein